MDVFFQSILGQKNIKLIMNDLSVSTDQNYCEADLCHRFCMCIMFIFS